MATYAANVNITAYLQGKGFSVLSADYHYSYFDDTEALQTALSAMPDWYYIGFANPWG